MSGSPCENSSESGEELKKVFSGENKSCRPFVKWAGGKRQLLPEIVKRLPEKIFTYHEPFIGGGALYFSLQPERAVISEINDELVNCYKVVKANVESLIEELGQHVYNKDYYYDIRNADRTEGFNSWTPVQRAARLLYLNKTCFNGLYRVNSKGQFNTPFGKYKNPRIVDAPNLRACSKALQNTRVLATSYENVEAEAREGDFVYFDPPYNPVNRSSSFTTYTCNGFDEKEQEKLRNLFERLDGVGVNVMLSNSATPLIEELYLGYNIERVNAVRCINSKSDRRGSVEEVIITNYTDFRTL